MNYFRMDYLLLCKWVIINFLGAFFLWYAWKQGWIAIILATDISFITPVIGLLTLFGVGLTGWWAAKISKELSLVKKGNINEVLNQFYPSPEKFSFDDAKNLESLKLLLTNRLSSMRHLAWALVVLGLIGTILGFVIVLLGIDISLVADISKLPMVMVEITTGLGIALYTTLAGALGNLWVLINYNMLTTATVQLYSYIITNHEVLEG